MIVVFDASTLVSASLKADCIPERALLRAIDASKYRDVLSRPKFDRFVSLERRQHILDIVIFAAGRIEPAQTVHECVDPADDKYLELAFAGDADVIVSSDIRHLLAMHPWRGTAILSPADFLALPA